MTLGVISLNTSMAKQLRCQAGAAISLFKEMLQPVTVDRHHAGFREGEESR
jgi:hypothetical protein